jgi:hypothetical protein
MSVEPIDTLPPPQVRTLPSSTSYRGQMNGIHVIPPAPMKGAAAGDHKGRTAADQFSLCIRR